MMQTYGRLSLIIAALALLVLLGSMFTGPLAFVFDLSEEPLGRILLGGLCLALTFLAARVIRRELIHGLLERRSGSAVPPLIGSLTSGLIIFLGLCAILGLVFKRDITALVATGGASLMILGLALRDVLLALFTGILLNVEKPFRVGDRVRINNQYTGKIVRITWRTTVIETLDHETVYLPNLTLANAVIMNMAQPDNRSKRAVEVMIRYDTSVDSAERILYAAVLGAAGVEHMAPPTVFARKLERYGVIYEVGFVISHYADGKKAEHAVLKNILQCMRDADITSPARTRIANRSLDVFHLVQQVRLFRGLPEDVCRRIAALLVERSIPAGKPIVTAGERRHAMFIIGEGMARRTSTDREGAGVITERFIATESFGRKALFACQAHNATVTAETAVLAYEFDRRALAALLAETPALATTLATALAQLSWHESHRGQEDDMPPAVLDRLVNIYRGQMEANYGQQLIPRPALREAG